jgi:glycosyltransferase involved in cell wall biosynthesis
MRLQSQPHPELVGSFGGYNLVRYRESFFGIPQLAGQVDLAVEEECRHAGVLCAATCEDLQQRIAGSPDTETTPVEFAGWLPVYETSGNCGRHPQFKHTAIAPEGYRFTCSAASKKLLPSLWQRAISALLTQLKRFILGLFLLIRPVFGALLGTSGVAPRDRFRVFAAMMRMYFSLRQGGARLVPVLRFLRSRNYQSQLLLARHRGLVFLPSMPYTYGQNPWVVEIEDPTTLFYPHVQNGETHKVTLSESAYFPIVRTLLESRQCQGVLTHMKSTADMIATLFGSDTIRAKVFHKPLGVKLPERWQRHNAEGPSDPIHLLFTSSWHQMPVNFFLRGGLDVLEAFSVLRERYPQVRLTLRTSLPSLDARYHRIIEQGWVRVVNRVLSTHDMEALLSESHIFLLPSARVHIVSLLQAMSHGLAVVTSDGWGFDEYVNHERNGLVVKGRYGKVSWADKEVGMLREDYRPMYKSNPNVVRGLIKAVSRLIENRGLRRRLGRNARHDVETTYNLNQWNLGLKEVFDMALSPSSAV